MAEGSGATGILGVIVGAAIVVALGLFLLGGNPFGGGTKSVDVNIKAPTTSAN
ncbi:MAG TPA: hypothetical protein VIL72_14965 [Beijerinckiaceae bacterium]|jgi:hypothetical protein